MVFSPEKFNDDDHEGINPSYPFETPRLKRADYITRQIRDALILGWGNKPDGQVRKAGF
jgi:hypothetical protein